MSAGKYTLRDAVRRYKSSPVDAGDKPESWDALDSLLLAAEGAESQADDLFEIEGYLGTDEEHSALDQVQELDTEARAAGWHSKPFETLNLTEWLVAVIKAKQAEVEEDICGLCGKPGADKAHHPEYWPGEQRPGTPYVHAECEDAECGRAHAELSEREIRNILRGYTR